MRDAQEVNPGSASTPRSPSTIDDVTFRKMSILGTWKNCSPGTSGGKSRIREYPPSDDVTFNMKKYEEGSNLGPLLFSIFMNVVQQSIMKDIRAMERVQVRFIRSIYFKVF